MRNVASLTPSTGPSSIRRVNRQSQIVVGANHVGRTQSQVMKDVDARLATLKLPTDVTVTAGGTTTMMNESFNSFLTSILLAVVFVYMVLASQFGSFTQPIVLMLALPLSLLGAFLALILANFSFDMTAMIGIILLMGLVTKNSILLVDFGQPAPPTRDGTRSGALDGRSRPVRPILMTTLSLILGMLPVAMGIGAGGSFRAPMAVAVIGGLITSMVLTLVLVPVAYSILDSIHQKFKRAPQEQVQAAPVVAE